MKTISAILIVFLVSFSLFAQESVEIKASELPKSVKGLTPENISVSEEDIMELGIYFEEMDLVTEVHFAVTDAVLNFSNTNNYLIEYNRKDQLIEFGCLIPSDEPGIFRLNDKLFITVEKQLDALQGPVTQGK